MTIAAGNVIDAVVAVLLLEAGFIRPMALQAKGRRSCFEKICLFFGCVRPVAVQTPLFHVHRIVFESGFLRFFTDFRVALETDLVALFDKHRRERRAVRIMAFLTIAGDHNAVDTVDFFR